MKNLTTKEYSLMRAWLDDEYAALDIDFLREMKDEDVSLNTETWMFSIRDYSELKGKEFSGVCSSLTEKGLITTDIVGDRGAMGIKLEDTYTIGMTVEGRKTFISHYDEKLLKG